LLVGDLVLFCGSIVGGPRIQSPSHAVAAVINAYAGTNLSFKEDPRPLPCILPAKCMHYSAKICVDLVQVFSPVKNCLKTLYLKDPNIMGSLLFAPAKVLLIRQFGGHITCEY